MSNQSSNQPGEQYSDGTIHGEHGLIATEETLESVKETIEGFESAREK